MEILELEIPFAHQLRRTVIYTPPIHDIITSLRGLAGAVPSKYIYVDFTP
jgi:hypothetical protein